ncbi:MAG: 50S ribosomal protein L24 [Thermodesulfobacteriota bacterium]
MGAQANRRKMNVKKGDTVYVVSGKEKGKTGQVIKVLRSKNQALVEKLNIVKRHTRPTQANPTGGIVEKEAPIHISNLMIYDETEKKPTRIGRRELSTGERVRFSKRSGEEIK